MATLEILNELFCKVFDEGDLKITPEMTANDVEGWDSLSHVNLIVAIETKFGIRFNQKELLSFKNIGDLLNCIDKKCHP
jgi:acyl carrier protein